MVTLANEKSQKHSGHVTKMDLGEVLKSVGVDVWEFSLVDLVVFLCQMLYVSSFETS